MKVYIWYPTARPFQLGHTAVTLENGTHISWWPKDKTEGKRSKKNPRDVGSLDEDIELEGRRPDKTFAVVGLDETASKKWWRDFLDTGEKYNVAIRNCCHIVLAALDAGGFVCKYWLSPHFWSDMIWPWRRVWYIGPLRPIEVEKTVILGDGVSDIS